MEVQHTARRSLVVAAVGVVSIVSFWIGLPVVLAAGAATLALNARRRLSGLPGTAIAALVLAALITVTPSGRPSRPIGTARSRPKDRPDHPANQQPACRKEDRMGRRLVVILFGVAAA